MANKEEILFVKIMMIIYCILSLIEIFIDKL